MDFEIIIQELQSKWYVALKMQTQIMTFAYFTPKPGNFNILGSYDTQVSKPGPPWPSCSYFSSKSDFVTPHQMSGHNICFYAELTKFISDYHQILPLI